MRNQKIQMLSAANSMKDVLASIEGLLDGYDGIEGNRNYVKYCHKKAKEAEVNNFILAEMYENTFNADMSKRVGINIAVLLHIIQLQFKLLDDIDTAGDMFKPTWCKITKVVEQLHRLRWMYCTVGSNTDEDGNMTINGECFKKEERVILTNN